jgi:hypothetical protein
MRRYPRNNSIVAIFITTVSLSVSIYIAAINRRNLDFNARNALASEKISEQLRIINTTGLVSRINGVIDNNRESVL